MNGMQDVLANVLEDPFRTESKWFVCSTKTQVFLHVN